MTVRAIALVAGGAWLLNAAVAIWWASEDVPTSLTRDAQAALADQAADWAVVSLDGRNATVRGLSGSEADEQAALAHVDGVWGVRHAEGRFERLPERSFVLRVRRDSDGSTIVSGLLPDAGAQGALKGALPGLRFTDLTTVGGPPAPDNFSEAAGYARDALAGVGGGRADLLEGRIVLRPVNDEPRPDVLGDPPPGWQLDWRADRATNACELAMAAAVSTQPIQFAVGSASLAPEAIATVEAIAEAARACPDAVLRVDGHTDVTGDAAFNYALSWRRADAVAVALRQRGIPADQVTRRGFGPDLPVAENATDAGRAQNRRIEFSTVTR